MHIPGKAWRNFDYDDAKVWHSADEDLSWPHLQHCAACKALTGAPLILFSNQPHEKHSECNVSPEYIHIVFNEEAILLYWSISIHLVLNAFLFSMSDVRMQWQSQPHWLDTEKDDIHEVKHKCTELSVSRSHQYFVLLSRQDILISSLWTAGNRRCFSLIRALHSS